MGPLWWNTHERSCLIKFIICLFCASCLFKCPWYVLLSLLWSVISSVGLYHVICMHMPYVTRTTCEVKLPSTLGASNLPYLKRCSLSRSLRWLLSWPVLFYLPAWHRCYISLCSLTLFHVRYIRYVVFKLSMFSSPFCGSVRKLSVGFQKFRCTITRT
jgi:hypothetical protein